MLEDAPTCRGPKLVARHWLTFQKVHPLPHRRPDSSDISQHHHVHFQCFFQQSRMSFVGPMPLRSVAPARVVSASRQCQRRNMSHASRAQMKRPVVTAQSQAQYAPSIRVCHVMVILSQWINSLTFLAVLPYITHLVCGRRSLQDPWCWEGCIGRRHQEGVLRPCEEVPSRHQ